jgi:hypothetical protein
MTASDLRIGNWVHQGDGFAMQVVAIFEDEVYINFEGNEGDVWECKIQDLQPFEIDQEWLEKFGFQKYDQMGSISYWYHENLLKLNGHVGLFPDGAKIKFIQMDWKDAINLKYVHKLQNLYHVLTGAEL